jgi:hypothetical protein
MNTYDVSHESPSMYMEQNAELKTLGLRTPRHHATKPLGCVPLGTMKRKILGLRYCVPLDTMKRKTVGLHTPWHQNETKTDDKHA